MGRFDPEDLEARLAKALDEGNREETEVICRELIDHLRTSVKPYEETDARNVMHRLRSKRRFDLMADVADAFLRSGLTHPQIRRQYAQALLDQGQVYPALAMLQEMLTEKQLPRKEELEAKGLVGRAYKQIYVDADDSRVPQNRQALQQAITAYLDVWKGNGEAYWHGVNAAALLERAHRDGVDLDVDAPDPQEIAQSIVKGLAGEVGDNPMSWDLATLAEASVALDDLDAASKYLNRYLEQVGSNNFEVASTLRQFEDVWRLDEEEGEERALTDLLRSHLLHNPGGEVLTSPGSVRNMIAKASQSANALEKVLGNTGYQRFEWLTLAMQRSQLVGRIWHGPNAFGTGFLLPGEALNAEWADRQVFLTNCHVISDPKGHPQARKPSQVSITFDTLESNEGAAKYLVKELLWQSAVSQCDTTILALDREVVGAGDFAVAADVPSQVNEDRLYVIGYPNGGDLSFSFQDNTLVDLDETYLQYRSPTDPGSSGSPVFNDAWELVGIHHAGSDQMAKLTTNGHHPANEGIRIDAIRRTIAGA